MPSKEELERAQAEYEELMRWDAAERKKIMDHLKTNGESIGLDTHQEYFRPIIEEGKRRFREIRNKYHLDEKQ